MKKLLLALLAIVLMPATFEVAAYGSQEAQEDNAPAESSSCGCKKRVRTCNTCPKPVKTCPKKCARVSKCLSCEERAAQEAQGEVRTYVDEDDMIVGEEEETVFSDIDEDDFNGDVDAVADAKSAVVAAKAQVATTEAQVKSAEAAVATAEGNLNQAKRAHHEAKQALHKAELAKKQAEIDAAHAANDLKKVARLNKEIAQLQAKAQADEAKAAALTAGK